MGKPVWEYSDEYCQECWMTKESSPESFRMGWHGNEGLYCDYCINEMIKENLRKTGKLGLIQKVIIK